MSTKTSYESIPHPPTPLGRAMYAAGRRLVADGARLSEIAWDADDVLWGWTMSASNIARRGRWVVTQRDIGHREYFRVTPGLFELLWGMHHASLEAGHDPWVRIWTSGYAWRLWRISQRLSALAQLLGPPASPTDAQTFVDHPRLFCRLDYVRAVSSALRAEGGVRGALRASPSPARAVLERAFARDLFDSSIKLPELATWLNKASLASTRVLVDDRRRSVARFVDSGRLGVYVQASYPRFLGRVPHTVWRARDYFAQPPRSTATEVAEALRALLIERRDAWVSVSPSALEAPYPCIDFHIDLPDEVIRREWLEPMRRLRRRAQHHGWREARRRRALALLRRGA